MLGKIIIPWALFLILLCVHIFFWKKVHHFNRGKENKKYLGYIYNSYEKGVFPTKKPSEVEKKLRKDHIVGHKRETFLNNYKPLYRIVVIYYAVILALTIAGIVYIKVDVCVFHWLKNEWGGILGLVATMLLWGLEVIFILKSVTKGKIRKIVVIIERLIIKVVNIALKKECEIYSLAVQILSFAVYIFICSFSLKSLVIEENIFIALLEVIFYRYFIVPVILFRIADWLIKLHNKFFEKINRDYKFGISKYVKGTLENSTYLVFILVHCFCKYCFPGEETDIGFMIEAIAIIYMIDDFKGRQKQLQEDLQNEFFEGYII